MSVRLTKEEFVERSKDWHGDLYDYSKSVYIDMFTKVEIFCNKHKVWFWHAPVSHSRGGSGCTECIADRKRAAFKDTKEQAIEKLPDRIKEMFDFTDTVYNGYHKPVNVRCKKHNVEFSILWLSLSKCVGCPVCLVEQARVRYARTTEEFILASKNIFGDAYIYDQTVYINETTPVIIGCKKHGYFKKQGGKHLSRQSGCPKCKCSRGERAIINVLDTLGVPYKKEWSTSECRDVAALRFDFRVDIGNKFILIEYDGQQHFTQNPDWQQDKHSVLASVQRRDKIKNDYCKKYDIPLLRIPYWEFPNIEHIVKNYIKEQQDE